MRVDLDRWSNQTVMDRFLDVRHYENTHHYRDCEMSHLSYCLDCHAAVVNDLAWLRGQGFTSYPTEMPTEVKEGNDGA